MRCVLGLSRTLSVVCQFFSQIFYGSLSTLNSQDSQLSLYHLLQRVYNDSQHFRLLGQWVNPTVVNCHYLTFTLIPSFSKSSFSIAGPSFVGSCFFLHQQCYIKIFQIMNSWVSTFFLVWYITPCILQIYYIKIFVLELRSLKNPIFSLFYIRSVCWTILMLNYNRL